MKKKIANAVYWGFRTIDNLGEDYGDLIQILGTLSLLALCFFIDWRLGLLVIGGVGLIVGFISALFCVHEWAKANKE